MYWWAQRDLNSRPPGYQPGAPASLSYGPTWLTLEYRSIIKGFPFEPPLTRFFSGGKITIMDNPYKDAHYICAR